jgi:hypothetical protein
MTRARWYVGLGAGSLRVPFQATATPTAEAFPQYGAVVGPFRTKRGADYLARYGFLNPHVRCVADAERLAREEVQR